MAIKDIKELSEFLRMPFEFRSPSDIAEFSRCIIVCYLDFVFLCIGDLLIASSIVNKRYCLSDHQMLDNPAKCKLGITQLAFLGHGVTPEDIKPSKAKVPAVLGYAVRSSIKECKVFWWLGNSCCHFIPHGAELFLASTELSRGNPRRLTISIGFFGDQIHISADHALYTSGSGSQAADNLVVVGVATLCSCSGF